MKKILTLALILVLMLSVLCVSLVACTDDEGGDGSTTTTTVDGGTSTNVTTMDPYGGIIIK